MTIAAIADSGVSVRYNLRVTLTPGVMLFTERGCIETSAYPRIVEWGDIPEDSDDLQRCMIAIEQKGPYRINSVDYWRLEEVFRAYPPIECVAALSVRYNNGVTSTERTILTGRVSQVFYEQTLVRIEVEARQELTKVKAPQYKIDDDLFSTAARRAVIPEASRGRAVPMAFGDPMPYVPPLFSAVTARTAIAQKLCRYGIIPPQGFPAIEIQREDTYSTFAISEYVDGLTLPLSAGEVVTENPPSGWVWIPQTNSWGSIWALVGHADGGISFGTSTFDSVAYYCSIARQPYVIAPARCAEWVSSESDTITDPKYAIDGKAETYAVIADTANEWVSWEVASAPGIGHIIANTYDGGSEAGGSANDNFVPNGPAGLQIYAILCFPIANLPTSGSITMGLKFPGATQDTIGSATYAYTYSDLTTLGMVQYGCVVITGNLGVAKASDGSTGAAADGWYGTKWGRGDITSVIDPTPSADSSLGPDLPLIHANTRTVLPMRVGIKSTLNQGVGIVDVGMRYGFLHEPLIDLFRVQGPLARMARTGRDVTGRRR